MKNKIPLEWIVKYPALRCPGHLFGAAEDDPAWLEWKRQRDIHLVEIEKQETAATTNDSTAERETKRPSDPPEQDNVNEANAPLLFQHIHPLGSTFFDAKLNFEPWAVGAPLIPTATQGTPKVALNSLYGKEYCGTPITNSSFFSWDNDGKPPHEERRGFTCVFVCPVTYEIFPSARYDSMATTKAGKDIQMWTDDDGLDVSLVWYSRKMEAEQGAAALRYDCWYYRKWIKNNPQAPKYNLIGMDEPYVPTVEHQQRLVERIPPEVMQRIESQIRIWRDSAVVRDLEMETNATEVEQDVMIEEEEKAYRDAYLETRGNLREDSETEQMIHTDGEDD